MSKSKLLRCIALDDEPHALKILSAYIEKTPFLELERASTSVWEVLDILKSKSPDLLFLDIQMEELTGLQLLDIAKPDCPVILTTAYSEYALKGYEYQVVDYLLKPFSFDRFLKAVAKVDRNIYPKKLSDSGSSITDTDIESIFIKGDAKHKYHQLKMDEIIYIEGLKNYVSFVCVGQKVISLQNLKDLMELLPVDRFIRIHKSYIINLRFVQQVEGHSVLLNGKRLAIGASYRTEFYARIKRV